MCVKCAQKMRFKYFVIEVNVIQIIKKSNLIDNNLAFIEKDAVFIEFLVLTWFLKIINV